MAAQAGGTQARASLQRIRRGGIASGSAWTVSGRLSYELYAARSRSVGGAMQAHPRQGYGGSGERWADGCTSGRNASQGEPTAYQARWHRFGVGLDSVRPPELRAVRGSLAFSRWRHASASPSRIWAARVSDGRMAAQAGGTQARASLQRIRRGGIASGSAWTVSGRLSYELYAARSRSVGGAMQAHPRQGYGGSGERWADGCTSGRNASQGEPTAYQARWHRFGVGLDSVRPPELRAVRGSLAFSRWRHASASPSRIGGSGERWADGCTSGRNASQGEPTAYQARWHRFWGPAWAVSSRLSCELYAACSRSTVSATQRAAPSMVRFHASMGSAQE